MIFINNRRRDKWNIGTVEELCEGKDNLIRAVKLRSRKTYIERPIQFFYRLELSCDTWKRQKTVHQCSNKPLNVNTSEERNAAAIAGVRIQDASEANKDEL